jgi:hypothetical protein
MPFGIAGTQHEMPVVQLAVMLGAEGQQISGPVPAAPREEADVMQLRPATVETSGHLTPPSIP